MSINSIRLYCYFYILFIIFIILTAIQSDYAEEENIESFYYRDLSILEIFAKDIMSLL